MKLVHVVIWKLSIPDMRNPILYPENWNQEPRQKDCVMTEKVVRPSDFIFRQARMEREGISWRSLTEISYIQCIWHLRLFTWLLPAGVTIWRIYKGLSTLPFPPQLNRHRNNKVSVNMRQKSAKTTQPYATVITIWCSCRTWFCQECTRIHFLLLHVLTATHSPFINQIDKDANVLNSIRLL